MKLEELQKKYGKGGEDVIINPRTKKTIKGLFYGNDECFELNEFYQYFVYKNKVYKVFYEIPENQELDNIDYEKPYRIELDEYYNYFID